MTDAAQQADLSRSQWTKIEAGAATTPRPQTLGRIERALGWTSGSIERFLSGGEEPTEDSRRVVTLNTPGNRDRLLADLRRELTRDEQGDLERQLLQAILDAQSWRDSH